MNSRERIQKLFKGEKIDRIPNGLGGCETAGLHILAYNTLKKLLDIKNSKTRMYTFMTNAVAEPSVLNAMNGDIIILNSKMCPSRLWGEGVETEWKQVEFWGEKFLVPEEWEFRIEGDGTIWWENINWKCPPEGIYFDPLPSAQETDLPVSQNNSPTPDDYNPQHTIPEEQLKKMENSAKWLYNNTKYAICCGETITDLQLTPGGTTSWWMRLIQEPDIAHEFLHKAVEAALDQLKLLDQAVGKYSEMLMIADDIGDAEGITIGPNLWRKIYKPHYKKLFTKWHKITDMKVSLHSCGAIREILGDLIECGVDIYNPVQISAKNMNPDKLKENFGDDIIFYGGAYDAINMPFQTAYEKVYRVVKENIKILKDNGNYIFAGVHNLPGNIPESHLKALLKAYNDTCSYNDK